VQYVLYDVGRSYHDEKNLCFDIGQHLTGVTLRVNFPTHSRCCFYLPMQYFAAVSALINCLLMFFTRSAFLQLITLFVMFVSMKVVH